MWRENFGPRSSRREGLAGRLRHAVLSLADVQARLISHAESSWASVTFAGTRHRIVLEFQGVEAIEAGETFIAALPEHEFTIAGQLVAEATITDVDHRLAPLPVMVVTAELVLLEES